MKIRFLYCIALCIFLLSCGGPGVTFEHPQPLDVSDMYEFPKKLWGKYMSMQDSSVITISDRVISRAFNMKLIACKKDLDTTACYLKNDTLYGRKNKEKQFVVNIHDTLYIPYHLQDTLFTISDKHLLRKYKGYYFLNMLYGESWEVQKLEYSRGKLCLCSISNKEEIENLRAITEAGNDSARFQFDPDKKQFHKFLKSKGFSSREEFVRIR